MATKPVAWEEQGPVSSLDRSVNESWAQGEVDAAISHSSPMQDKKAPRAEPEEDIDVLEPGAQDETLQGNQTLSRTTIAVATKLEKNQESTTPRETQEVVTELEQVPKKQLETSQAQEASENLADEYEDAFPPPPPPPLSALSTEECFEKEAFSSLEGEAAECLSDVEIFSDPAEDLLSPDKELIELVDQEVDSASEENGTADEMDTQLHFLPDGLGYSESENNTSGDVHHSPSDINNSGDAYTVCSPPFADESEEEEEMKVDITCCQQQCGTLEIRSKPFQTANIPLSTEQAPASALPAVPSAKQQGELLPQSQCGLTPRGANQEAAQQVQGQGSPPLSTVAMELSNQGGTASQGFGCVVAVRERHSRVGERTVGESEQTGGVERQKERGLERSKAARQQHGRGLLRYSKTVQVQELRTEKYSCGVSFKHSKHVRMESDSCDDSQSDSGVSADFSPCSTLEGNTTMSTGNPGTVPKETPIEREIRRAVEREHSLRRSRGLPNLPTSPEYVEIPLRKTVLCQSLTTERCQGKDRQFAGKKMEHDIHEEARREQDLVKLGKVPGFYDKGTVRQLKERKQLFEAFQKPSDSTLTVSTRCKTTSWSSASDISTLEEDISSQISTAGRSYVERRRSLDLLNPTESPILAKGGGSTSSTPRGPGVSEGTGRQVTILEDNLSVSAQKLYHARQEAQPVTTVDSGSPNISSSMTGGHGAINGRKQEKEEEEEEEAPKENPFYKLRSSTNLVKVEQDIREAQEREKELRKQRISLYGGTGGATGGERGGGRRSASIEGQSPALSPSSLNGLAVPDLPGSSPRWATGPSAAHQSVGKFAVWPPPQAEEGRSEVLLSPRTPRQKTPLVQRWESGLLNGHNEDDN
ncbi:uncharacterized protein LOC111650948 [Seriola lalandi dorsalis]|uniref:Uncharacterized LOC111650948 n=1 Tax=Seriola lalandi dorsalis TaxID=1841481 RepID=A0A3B4XT06_SERLL|nr:uncharacterized protein LOC111650948 [Seriola lalandi dorsalis]